ncbi:MAG: antitoxin [Patescibacteria group bacterium]
MTSVSISQLKANPAAVLSSASDYPVAVQNRNKTAGYLVGKDLFEKMILFLEDIEDKKTIESIDLDDKGDFEEFAKELGI